MAFVRVKTIKGRPYAYLVENTWKGNSSRQKVKEYLGGVLRFPAPLSAPAPNMNGDFASCVQELIAWNLQRMGFARKGNFLSKGSISLQLDTDQFLLGRKPAKIVIANQNGFICRQTLGALQAFQLHGSDHESGQTLAKAVVEAGLEVPKELFVALFEKARSARRTIPEGVTPSTPPKNATKPPQRGNNTP